MTPVPDAEARKREIYTKAFKAYDKDGSNSIDANELESLLQDLGWNLSIDDVRDALKILDTDGNGDIDLDEFLNWSNYAWERFVLHSSSTIRSSNTTNKRSNTNKVTGTQRPNLDLLLPVTDASEGE